MPAAHLEAAAAALGGAGAADGAASGLRVPYEALRSPSSGLRVNKWDALILDAEILGLLKSPVKNMFARFEPGAMDRVKPEVDAALAALLFAFTTGVGRVRRFLQLLLLLLAADLTEDDAEGHAGDEAGERALRPAVADAPPHCGAIPAVGWPAVRLEASL